MKHSILYFLLSIILISCKEPIVAIGKTTGETTVSNTADSIIKLSQDAHGVNVFDKNKFNLTFRNKEYSFDFTGKGFVFTRVDSTELGLITDYYNDSIFWRSVNGEKIDLNSIDVAKFSSSINSVIYFATLPYKLSDAGVISNYKGQQKIKSQNYDVVEISFQEAGGGEDHQDIFYYWFNSKTHYLDYFAYQYETNGGGVRFREAINQVAVGGAVFQDYVNYEVPVGTHLSKIPNEYEMNSLTKLSLIENELIRID
ncbi:MAG: DUF6503 family protein [Crocinitomicaceae bacterium]